MHQQWENEREVFELRCRCKKLEIENEALNHYRDLVKYEDFR
jgi:hypothetical protein